MDERVSLIKMKRVNILSVLVCRSPITNKDMMSALFQGNIMS